MPFDGKIELFTKPNKIADMLRRAKASLDTPDKWWQRGCMGRRRIAQSSRCALVAIDKAGEGAEWVSAGTVFAEAVGLKYASEIPRWNDAETTTHADLMAAFDKAIALAEQD